MQGEGKGCRRREGEVTTLLEQRNKQEDKERCSYPKKS